MKIARFADVVERTGRPQIHLTWSAPEKDEILQRALKQHRVMTVHQHTRGGKKDFAMVGLEPTRDAQFLIFPKSLRRFQQRRIVAIDYALMEQSPSVSSTLPPSKRRKIPAKPMATSPRGASPSNLIRFESAPAALATAASRPTQPATPDRATVKAANPPADPLTRDLRLALRDLQAGNPQRCEKRLVAMLKRREQMR